MYTGNRSIPYPECRFIKSDGRRCHSPAMRGMAYCFFHQPSRRRATGKGRPPKPICIELPSDGDGQSYRKSLSQLRAAVAEGRLDHLKARLCFYGIQIAAQVNKIDAETSSPSETQPANAHDDHAGETPL
jgi:hypothetical protein